MKRILTARFATTARGRACCFPLARIGTLVLLLFAFAIVPGGIAPAGAAPDAKASGIVECTDELLQKHNPGIAPDVDRPVCFTAYVSNFDTRPRTAGANEPRFLAIPHWTIQRVDRAAALAEGRGRPRAWFTIPDLAEQGIAPTDASYHFSQRFRARNANWYERGHLAQKYLAERLAGKAGWFTHNVANAVPQRARFNKGPWLTLECYTGAWANAFGTVWIISGPIFFGERPGEWLKSDTNRRAISVAVPDALFKIVVKKAQSGAGHPWDILAFIYPQDHDSYKKGPWDPAERLQTVARIEELIHERFLPDLDGSHRTLKTRVADALWPVEREDFDPSCKRFAPKTE